MNKQLLLRVKRLTMAAVVFAAIIAQIVKLHSLGTFNAADFFSFFTIEANILAAVVLVWCAIDGKPHTTIRGGATLYMAITGVIYALLLSHADVQTPLPWVNFVLHYLFPVVMVADWVYDNKARPIKPKRALWWLVFPLAYAVYSLARGAIVHWYPYPFINVDKLGYGSVLVNCVVVALAAFGLMNLLLYLPRLVRR